MVTVVSISLLTLVQKVSAVINTYKSPKGLLQGAGDAAGYAAATENTLSGTVGNIVYAALGLLGTVFLVLIVYAGYLWMTAGGEEQQIEKAKGYIKNSVIGLVIILAAFGITRLIMNSLLNSTGVE